jgi:hypothetical protein
MVTGAEPGLFVREVKINIKKYNIVENNGVY